MSRGVGRVTGSFFVAGAVGTYMIIRGYPGHAIAGMWDSFAFSGTARVTSITCK